MIRLKRISDDVALDLVRRDRPQKEGAATYHYEFSRGVFCYPEFETPPSGWLDYIVNLEGFLLIGIDHAFLSKKSKTVRFAGGLHMSQGVITKVSDDCGHYLPTEDNAHLFIGTMKENLNFLPPIDFCSYLNC